MSHGPTPPQGADREPIPPGRISTVRGRRQAPILRGLTRVAFVAATLGVVFGGRPGRVAGWTAVGLVTVTPLARVGWLIWRWWSEHDRRFVAAGIALLVVVAAGTTLSLLGVTG